MTMARHLLIDVDSKIPNLALMKISAWAKKNGDDVDLNTCRGIPDTVWISCVFDWNRERAITSSRMYASFGCDVELGGSGIDLARKLPVEIEEQIPDYALYGDDRAIGFAQRGCNRRCEFCIVPKKEGMIRENAYFPVSTWTPEGFSKVLLLDNNMAQSPHHDEILADCREHGYKLCITQGYDIRCMTPERAKLLAKDKPWSLKFRERRLYIAWDYFFIKPYVIRGIEMLLNAGFKGREIMCYCLVGFNTTPEQDMHRVKVLDEFGVLPFIMPYNRNSNPKYHGQLSAFARWVNGRYYQFVPWEKYSRKRSLIPAA